MPVSWKSTVVRYSGRLHRLHPGKTEVRIYDHVDRRPNIVESSINTPGPAGTRTNAMTIAGSDIVGGLVPPVPYFIRRRMRTTTLVVSMVVIVLALRVFGSQMGTFCRTAVVGGSAAAAAFAMARRSIIT
jgi:VIT1/CCC1 family predicted Fe2+/Mn2+ transporter